MTMRESNIMDTNRIRAYTALLEYNSPGHMFYIPVFYNPVFFIPAFISVHYARGDALGALAPNRSRVDADMAPLGRPTG